MASAVRDALSKASPFAHLCAPETLHAAWKKVRANALASCSATTRAGVARFEASADRTIGRLASELSSGDFRFERARGVAVPRPGKEARPIVVSPIENRIVERALLDVLYAVEAVRALASSPTSFGGLPGRGVPDAIALAVRAAPAGGFFLRSDIADFYRSIPRDAALRSLGEHVGDERLMDVLDRALVVDLENRAALGEDARLFPDGETGISQGSSLSTLIANVILRGFDERMNGRGITCVRYVDDFLLLGERRAHVQKAFQSAQRELGALGLRAYDPADGSGKARLGRVADGFELLGCRVEGGRVAPSPRVCAMLLRRINRILSASGRSSAPHGAWLAQLSALLDGFWGAYKFCDREDALADLATAVDARIARHLRSPRRAARPQAHGIKKAPRRWRGGDTIAGASVESFQHEVGQGSCANISNSYTASEGEDFNPAISSQQE